MFQVHCKGLIRIRLLLLILQTVRYRYPWGCSTVRQIYQRRSSISHCRLLLILFHVFPTSQILHILFQSFGFLRAPLQLIHWAFFWLLLVVVLFYFRFFNASLSSVLPPQARPHYPIARTFTHKLALASLFAPRAHSWILWTYLKQKNG